MITFVNTRELPNRNMKNRILSFLSAENITQSQFADTLGVARASVSHILAGRNKPSYEFIESLALSYPSINLEWLITGKGRMYKDAYNDDLFDNKEQISPAKIENKALDASESIEKNASLSQAAIAAIPKKESRHISKIVVFYDDSTYLELV